jgi:flagellar biosynthesis GTPase FlhF
MTTYTYDMLFDLLEYACDCNTNLRLVLAYLDPDNSNSYDNWILSDEVVVETEINCACSHEIQNNFKIKHKTTGDMVIIGSSCVSKFSKEMHIAVGRRVRRLKDTTGAKYCSDPDCNKKINKSVVIQYPTQEKHYHKSCLDKVFKKCRNCKCYKTYDCDCEKRRIETEKRAREMRIEREKEHEKRVIEHEKIESEKRIKEKIDSEKSNQERIELERIKKESQREREIEEVRDKITNQRIEKESQREREIEREKRIQEKRIQDKITNQMREKLMLENSRIAHVMLEKSRLSQAIRKCIEENCTNELKDPKNPEVRCVSCLYKPKYREKAQTQTIKIFSEVSNEKKYSQSGLVLYSR